MTNHVHLVVTPPGGDALAKAIGRTHFLYAQCVNRLHRRSGHLWQARFYSCVLGDSHLVNTMAYVERNPVRVRIVRQAWEYPWSSAAAHVTGSDSTGLPIGRPHKEKEHDGKEVRAGKRKPGKGRNR